MGVGGGALLVRGLTTIFRLYDERQRGPAFMVFACMVNAARASLPVIFALVTDHGGWPLAFLVDVLLACMAAVIIYLFVPSRVEFEHEPPSPDVVSTGLIVTGLSALQVVMGRGEQDSWLASALIQVLVLVSLVCLAAFVWWDARRENANPLLNLRLLLTEPGLFSGLGMMVIFGEFLAAGLYVLPQYLRSITGYNALQTSLFFGVDAIATGIGIWLALRLMAQWPGRGVIVLGLSRFTEGFPRGTRDRA
jgi:MFS transporter, DHA2 family, multidrug resistance protein